jgi:hypothetical protein
VDWHASYELPLTIRVFHPYASRFFDMQVLDRREKAGILRFRIRVATKAEMAAKLITRTVALVLMVICKNTSR